MKAETSSALPVVASPKNRVAWPHLILAALGLAASFYAVHVHNLILAGSDTGCSISETISCDKVIGSKWGVIFGIPAGYLGAIFWLIMIIVSFSGAKISLQNAALQRLGVATVGLLSSVFFAYIAHFVIGKFCPVCAATHLLTLLNFLTALFLWLKARKLGAAA